jgi:hypothetical protein
MLAEPFEIEARGSEAAESGTRGAFEPFGTLGPW